MSSLFMSSLSKAGATVAETSSELISPTNLSELSCFSTCSFVVPLNVIAIYANYCSILSGVETPLAMHSCKMGEAWSSSMIFRRLDSIGLLVMELPFMELPLMVFPFMELPVTTDWWLDLPVFFC